MCVIAAIQHVKRYKTHQAHTHQPRIPYIHENLFAVHADAPEMEGKSFDLTGRLQDLVRADAAPAIDGILVVVDVDDAVDRERVVLAGVSHAIHGRIRVNEFDAELGFPEYVDIGHKPSSWQLSESLHVETHGVGNAFCHHQSAVVGSLHAQSLSHVADAYDRGGFQVHEIPRDSVAALHKVGAHFADLVEREAYVLNRNAFAHFRACLLKLSEMFLLECGRKVERVFKPGGMENRARVEKLLLTFSGCAVPHRRRPLYYFSG